MIASTKPTTSRPWRRLHVSTWIVALLMACIFAIVIFAGDRRVYPRDYCEHGWPFRFLQREFQEADFANAVQMPEPLSLWSWRDHVAEFDATALAMDLAIGLAAIMLLTALVEFRRRRRGRFWQITLREVFAISMVVAIASAWVGRSLQLTRRQQKAADRIAKAFHSQGISFGIGWEKRGCWFFELFTKHDETPTWFGDVVRISAPRPCQNPDEILKELDNFPQLHSLCLPGHVSSASAYNRLQGCKQLEVLSIYDSQLTDDAMKYLGSLEHLTFIGLSRNAITDEGLKHLHGLKRLEVLIIDNNAITDKGLKHLHGLKRLDGLSIDNNAITDEGLKHLHGLKRLETLFISNNPITDQGVEALQRAIPGLEVYDD